MKFHMPAYSSPDFTTPLLQNAPDALLVPVEHDGVSPANYHALSIFPEYFKVNGRWILATESRMDTVCVIEPTPGNEKVHIVEFRNLRKGDLVVVGRSEDGSEGIYLHTQGFAEKESAEAEADAFAFRSGRSRETAYSIDYDHLYDVLRHEQKNGGSVTWVLGAALSLDEQSRSALESLIRGGFVNALICGTALAAFDLERATFGSTWGQKIFAREQNSTLNYYRTINAVRHAGSCEAFVKTGRPKDGIIKACVECNVPFVIAGTIRDRLLLPDAWDNVYEAQDAMRHICRKTSTIVMASTILFTVATGNMTPSYNEFNDTIRPVYMYTVDIQEFAVNKLSDRGTLTATSIVTNSQDFVVNIARALVNF